ncbi:MAG: hypothetical protein ACI9XO_002048 [Paraglaciecola sp.]|jgi:hypothetical protein
MSKRRVKLLQCPNCETTLPNAENFCPSCGQENHQIIRPASHLWTELIENLFNIDSRFFRTVKTLFFKPGTITKEYNAGKRKYYLSPIRIYLLASVVFFLLQSISFKVSDEQVAALKNKGNENLQDTIHLNFGMNSLVLTKEEAYKLANLNEEKIDSLLIDSEFTPNFFSRKMLLQSSRLLNGEINSVTQLTSQGLSFAMFLLMPLFALLLLLFYRKQKKIYVEHLVFSIHFHAVAFILMSAGYFAKIVFDLEMLGNIFDFLVLVYLFLYLKNVYRDSVGKMLLKFLGLLMGYGLLLAIAFMIIGFIAVFIF